MSPIWQQLFVLFGGNAVLLAACGWMIRSLITHQLTKESKQFEIELRAKADVSIATLNNTLEIQSLEHQIRFSKLHEKRADVIAETYRLLVEAYWAGHNFLSLFEFSGEPSKAEKYLEAMNKLRDFYRYIETHRIYLPESICSLLDKFLAEMGLPVTSFGVFSQIQQPTDDTKKKTLDVWTKGFESFEKEIPATRKALEDEFRHILGGKSELASLN